MNAEEYHNKFMQDEMNLMYLVKAVYGDGDEAIQAFNDLNEMEKMQIVANAGNVVVVTTKNGSRKLKYCIVCGAAHLHNNTFCCKEHKELYDKRKKNDDSLCKTCEYICPQQCGTVLGDVGQGGSGEINTCINYKFKEPVKPNLQIHKGTEDDTNETRTHNGKEDG